MITPHRAPWTERLYKLLAKGPMRREVIVSKAASAVPPARAAAYTTRRFEMRRAREGYRGIQPRPRMPVAEAVLSGQQCLVRESLRSQILLGNIVPYEEDGVKWVRLPTPEEEEARQARVHQARHNAGKKGWDTRREDPEALVDSYQRGVKTKRSKSPDALSEISKKGWETRRRRQAA